MKERFQVIFQSFMNKREEREFFSDVAMFMLFEGNIPQFKA